MGGRTVVWVSVPYGWWAQGFVNLGVTTGCPRCMETPLKVAVAVAPLPSPEATCDECSVPITPGFACDPSGSVHNNSPGKHDQA